jgi:hypothetical protein
MIEITGNRSGETTGRTGDTTGKATLRTLWSETLVEMLYDAIQHEWSNNALSVIIKELYNKGYNRDRLMKMVEKKFGKQACLKIIRILFS